MTLELLLAAVGISFQLRFFFTMRVTLLNNLSPVKRPFKGVQCASCVCVQLVALMRSAARKGWYSCVHRIAEGILSADDDPVLKDGNGSAAPPHPAPNRKRAAPGYRAQPGALAASSCQNRPS